MSQGHYSIPVTLYPAPSTAAFKASSEIASAVVSHETGTAVVTLAAEISDDALKAAVEGAGYKVTGIE